MDSILGLLLSYLLLYKYVALFSVIFTAGIIMPWPTNTLLIAVGAFASQGYFGLTASFAVSLAANLLGDLVGYFLTRALKHRVVKKQYLEKIPYLASLERYVSRHARLTIVITRFMGTPGSIVNFLAGLAGVPVRRFVIFDVIGNALDIGLFLGLGYDLGSFTENLSDLISLLGWIFLVGCLIFVVAKIAWRKK